MADMYQVHDSNWSPPMEGAISLSFQKVPSNKKVLLKYISLSVTVPIGQTVSTVVLSIYGLSAPYSGHAYYDVIASKVSSGWGYDFWHFNQSINAWIPAGSAAVFSAQRWDGSPYGPPPPGYVWIQGTLSGDLLDAAPPWWSKKPSWWT